MSNKVLLIGIGPGKKETITDEAVSALKSADVLITFEDTLAFIKQYVSENATIITEKMSPVKRSELAISYARCGMTTGIVAFGHPGFFAIASTFYGVLGDITDIEVESIPGMTMIDYATAVLGSPLGRDYAVISIADQASPWEEIFNRAKCAFDGDFVVAIYNPIGKLDDSRLKQVIDYVKLKHNAVTGLIIGKTDGTQETIITDLESIPYGKINQNTLIIIGNTYTINQNGKMVTPRPYIEGKGY